MIKMPHQCSASVFIDERWSMQPGFRPCSRVAHHQDPETGKWYCKQHLPANVEARRSQKIPHPRRLGYENLRRDDIRTRLELILGIPLSLSRGKGGGFVISEATAERILKEREA